MQDPLFFLGAFVPLPELHPLGPRLAPRIAISRRTTRGAVVSLDLPDWPVPPPLARKDTKTFFLYVNPNCSRSAVFWKFRDEDARGWGPSDEESLGFLPSDGTDGGEARRRALSRDADSGFYQTCQQPVQQGVSRKRPTQTLDGRHHHQRLARP